VQQRRQHARIPAFEADGVGPRIAAEIVVAEPAVDRVALVAAADHVGARAAEQGVVAALAIERVVAVAALELVG
jgi:hypothetical protein